MAKENPHHNTDFSSGAGLWVLIALAAVLGCVCVWAETNSMWYWAQGACIGILFLLGMAIVDWWREHRVKRPVPPEVSTYYQALEFLLLAIAIGIIGVMIVACGADRWQKGIVAKSAGTGILFAGASFAVGVLFGFLFGFPPTPSSTPSPSPSPQPSGAPSPSQSAPPANRSAEAPSSSVFQNTNLQEISDWLTKVIVGAGLVDLTRLPPQIWKLAKLMAASNDPQTGGSPGVALAIMGYFSACGVLFGYVWTRFEVLTSTRPPDYDTEALRRVDRWLNQPPGPQDEDDCAAMVNAIKAASVSAQVKILLEADKYRSAGTQPANERSLPIFQALVEADAQKIFHRNRGQNALALMGSKADWKSALDLLNEAICIRDLSGEPDWHEYEFARAICRIHLDDQFNRQQKSAPEVQSSIRADLGKTGDVSDTQKKMIDPEGVEKSWGDLNG